MVTSDDLKFDRDKEMELSRFMILNASTYSDAQVLEFANELVQRRALIPAYRDPYENESARGHAEFVTNRLRLIWAMRAASEKQNVEIEYYKYLRGE